MQPDWLTYYYWLSDISGYSVALPLLVGFYQLRKKKDILLVKLVLLLAGFAALMELASAYTYYKGLNNLWLSHLYDPVEYLILASIFFVSFEAKGIRRGIVLSVLLLTAFSLWDSLLGEGLDQMNSYPRVLESAFVVALGMLYFYKVFNDLRILHLDHDPMFLLSGGAILYFAGTVMAYSMFNVALAESYNMARVCLSVGYVLNIFFNLVLVQVLRKAS
ncbi:MAG: hypothetical protein LPK07_12460 [Hymenobacteraceae bacterium]|nr:hypothetical protein [Hymenobacteraceae bacterium]MDX5482484.1 hypothetical protein [Hymenobacteraceae bacterium]